MTSFLDATARRAVAAFRTKTDVQDLPESDPDWNRALITAIRRRKDRFRDSEDLEPLLDLAATRLYGKEMHWALELVQNAEDAEASNLIFIFEADRIVVVNNGIPFSSRDAYAICSAGHSPKRNKIGFFGIGFKSVHQITDLPQVHSGPFAFEIADYLYPAPLPRKRRAFKGSRFVLPIRDDAHSSVDASLSELTGPEFLSVLLTLRHLRTIRVVDRTAAGRSGRFTRTSSSRGSSDWDECTIDGTWDEVGAASWRRHYYRSAPLPEGVARARREFEPGDRSEIVLARPLNQQVQPTLLHCFLPMEVESQLRWLVQADFEPNAARERPIDNAWNRWLFEEVGAAAAAAIFREAKGGHVPWDLIPLDEEVRDPLQRTALDRMRTDLKAAPFVPQERGFGQPEQVVWPELLGIEEVVSAADLQLLIGRRVSYVRQTTAWGAQRDRAGAVLRDLDALSASQETIVDLLALDDRKFKGSARSPAWWLKGLDLIARHPDPEVLDALAKTKCIPVRPHGRVRPAPSVHLKGYLVAFSRSDNIDDLSQFFDSSDLRLVGLPAPQAAADEAQREAYQRVRAMLHHPRFHVALEAGPYHVVNDLVLPRMSALADGAELTRSDQRRLWRMVEYVRQKWPTYLAEYRRNRSNKSESQIAAELSPRMRVVAVTTGRGPRPMVARSLTATYLPGSMIGHAGMDSVLAGRAGVYFISEIHARPLRTLSQPRRRRKTPSPSPVNFLRLLGAPIGPLVEAVDKHWEGVVLVTREQVPWVDWMSSDWWRPLGLRDDWRSPDLTWFVEKLESWSKRQRKVRALALWECLQDDWTRLAPMARTAALFKYYGWGNTVEGEAATSWLGVLWMSHWVRAMDGSWQLPRALVLNTELNSAALAGDLSQLLGWPVTNRDGAVALGLHREPTVDQLLDSLSWLRDQQEHEATAVLNPASACYSLLARRVRDLKEDARVEFAARLKLRFEGNHQTGLVLAPPPIGTDGRRWWPSSRVVLDDQATVAGPFIGQLAGRYPGASALWEILGIEPVMTPRMAADVIRRDLVNEGNSPMVSRYYAAIVEYLNQQADAALGEAATAVPALTSDGWVLADMARWSSRRDVRDAYGVRIAWWTPGSLDPSSVQRAANWLGIAEVRPEHGGGQLKVSVTTTDRASAEVDLQGRWVVALKLWPNALRSQAPDEYSAVPPALWKRIANLKPYMTEALTEHFSYRIHGELRSARIDWPCSVDGSSFVARSWEALYARPAAEAIADLLPDRREFASSHLRGLLADAQSDPAALARASGQLGVYDESRSPRFEQPEPDQEALAPTKGRLRRTKPEIADIDEPPPIPQEPPLPFANPDRYRAGALVVAEPNAEAAARRTKLGIRAPQPSAKQKRSRTRPPISRDRFINMDTEKAARWCIEDFEWQRGEITIERQGPGVGADYVSSDGRYVEVKSWEGSAPESLDLTEISWKAARRPDIRDRFWVYVVEHLRDGHPPLVTAVHNPVVDSAVITEPKGTMTIHAWRSATLAVTSNFEEVSAEPSTE